MIFVRLGQEIFKSDYITRYLHTWVVLRLCIIFTIGESPRVCSKFSHWYYLLLIWGGAKVSSIAIELLLQDGQRKLCEFVCFAIELLFSWRTTRPKVRLHEHISWFVSVIAACYTYISTFTGRRVRFTYYRKNVVKIMECQPLLRLALCLLSFGLHALYIYVP